MPEQPVRLSRPPHRASADEFGQILLESGLVSKDEMDMALAALSGAAAPADQDAFLQRLTDSAHLTDYQIKLVRTRKFSELVIGNYEVLDRLGAGGMGIVYKARHRRMKRVVALKVLAKNLADDESFVQRFQREVETIAQLNHPNIVMAFDADVSEAGHFLVMEYVNGRDLDFVVEKEGPLSVSAAVDCIVQVAQGLEYVHSRGMIHRDIKPANLLRDSLGIVKVTDLGLARFRNKVSAFGGITQAGGIVGTVDFMSPEQAMDASNIDQRADVYSLGATLWFLLTGQPPYPEESLTGTLLKHRDGAIPSLIDIRKQVPPGLDVAFRRMMAKAPADRFQSMTEVLTVLKAIQAKFDDTANIPGPAPVLSPRRAAAATPLSQSENLETSQAADKDSKAQTIAERGPRISRVGQLKVILVEPSRAQSGIIRRYLQSVGIEQLVAVASGRDALGAVRTDNPDVIVCALHLPDMTGVQLAEQVRAECRSVPGFVLISSEAESSEAGTLSKYGKGMVLQKPFTPEKLASALKLVTDPSARPAPSCSRLRVLIVDDSAAARLQIRQVLKELGLERFVEAGDGAQAVAALARETFDLIVTDYNMPFMDGRGLIGYLKQNPATATVPIILVTTETDPAKLETVRQLGVTVCDKSFPADAVRTMIEQIARVP